MSLNTEERKRTSAELRTNLRLSKLTEDDIAADLGLSSAEVQQKLDVAGDS